jgi:hypothetical protein
MNLETAIKGMLDAQDRLRTVRGTSDPDEISEQMQRLSQYTGAVELHLASFERDYEIRLGKQLGEYLAGGSSASAAESRLRVELAKEKGELKYLTRIVGSAWRQVGVAQSRHNHLTREKSLGGKTT